MTEPATPATGPAPSLNPGALPPRSSWFGMVRGLLVFSGVCYVLLGMGLAPFLGFMMQADGEAPAWLGWIIGGVGFLMCAGFGALNFVAAVGLDRETRWGWILSLVLAAMYAPSACLPVGVLMLIGLLQDDVRKTCMGS